MSTDDLELYLLRNGFETGIAPEVWMNLKEDRYIDLAKEGSDRLTVANDSVRMDIRIAADEVSRRRREIALSRNIPLSSVPFRVQWD